MFTRTFSQSTRTAFQKAAIKKSIPRPTTPGKIIVNKWQPSNGNSFRSFAEYRIKVTNQSPLAIAAKNQLAK
ncbi:hypothetical protein MEM_03632 [Candida albicans L26]